MTGRLALIASLLAACSDELDPRATLIANTLVAADRALIARDANLVAQKYAKMASGPFDYLRGTAAVFAEDLSAPESAPELPNSRFVTTDAARVALVGDAHLENVGTYRLGDDAARLDLNDFDAATFGPFVVDVWRLGVSLVVATADLPLSGVTSGDLAERMATAYGRTVLVMADGGAAPDVTSASSHGALLDSLLAKAVKQGLARKELADYTSREGTRRVLRSGAIEPEQSEFFSDTLLPASPLATPLITEALAEYALEQSRLGVEASWLTLKCLSRRLGAGVGSYPLYRYYALVEGPTTLDDDDWLFEVKEVRDGLALAGVPIAASPRFESNAHRVVWFMRQLQASPGNDPRLGAATASGLAFRLRDRTAFQRSLSVETLRESVVEGKAGNADLMALADAVGTVLGRAHAQGLTVDGAPAAPAIAAALRDDVAGFAAEVRRAATAYAGRTQADFQLFKRARERLGPLLGAPL